MGRLNDVRIFGFVADTPTIAKTLNNEYTRGMMHLAVVRSTRYSGETGGERDRILFDWPLVLTNDPELIRQMEKLKQYDLVELKGMFLTRKIKKVTYCKVCGARNSIEGNICYVRPSFLVRRSQPSEKLTEKQAIQELITNREISNNISILGNLCNDVNYFKDVVSGRRIETSVFQIATDRKYYVKEDDPEVRTDFPIVRSYQKQAVRDRDYLHTGSTVLIDGFLHTREFDRKSICPSCEQEYEWKDNTIEIIPYINEFIANYNTDEEAAAVAENWERIAREKAEQEYLELRKNLFK